MFKAFVTLIVGSLFLTCLLTPVVCELIIHFTGQLNWPFSRVFDRVAMVGVVIMLLVTRKAFSLHAVKEFLQRGSKAEKQRQLFFGLSLSLLSSLVIYVYLLQTDVLSIQLRETWYYIRKIPVVILAAFLISLIEEGFFRVICLQTAKEKLGFLVAAILISLLYASVHFIAPLKSFHYLQGEYAAGFVYLSAVFGSVLRAELLPAFAGLWIVGMVLSLAIERAKSLYLCLGLHTGWIIALKLVTFTSSVNLNFESALARRYVLVAFPVTWLALLAVVAFLMVRFGNSSRVE
ncbi:MAG: CPBP family intramembrane metalloprotease [Bdellovibrionales bacterium]|nr:CPBP family intramembrane metalloprotease [Bdellovibrionales bacterium]